MILHLFLKMMASSAILFGYYYLFLRNKRFHHYNRFYLLSITLLSIILPWIRIPVFIEANDTTAALVSRSLDLISVGEWEEGLADESSSLLESWLSWETLSAGIYLAVMLILAYSLVRSLMYIRTLTRHYKCNRIDKLKFYITAEAGTPFSFFKFIFWNAGVDVQSNDGQKIFRHELFHVKQKHSIDILAMEIICILFWVNPVFHLIKKEIRAIHEFLADQHAINDDNHHDYAELLLLQTLRLKKSVIPNYFFQNHIKRRIAMITQMTTKKYGYWSRILVLPLAVIIFCSIALYAKRGMSASHQQQPATAEAPRDSETLTIIVDAGHGGTDNGASNEAGILEKDLTLAIAKKLQEQAASHNLKVVMTREADVTVGLKQRSELAHAAKANLFVSIHVNNAPKEDPESGFDIFITNRNNQTLTESRRLGEHISSQIDFYQIAAIKQHKQQGIWVLDQVNCPAVLIECGYLSNEKDLAFISQESNQDKVAKAILQGVLLYKRTARSSNTTDTVPQRKPGIVSDSLAIEKMQAKKIAEMHKRLEEGGSVLKAKQKEFESQQQQLAIQQQKLTEKISKDLAGKEKNWEEKQAALRKKMEVSEKDLQVKMIQKQHAFQTREKDHAIKQEVIQQKLQKVRREQVEKQHELAIQLKQMELEFDRAKKLEAHVAELEKLNAELLQKNQQLELDRKKKIEANYKELENMKKKIQNEKG